VDGDEYTVILTFVNYEMGNKKVWLVYVHAWYDEEVWDGDTFITEFRGIPRNLWVILG